MKKNIVKKIVAITFAAAMALTISPMAKAATADQLTERHISYYRGEDAERIQYNRGKENWLLRVNSNWLLREEAERINYYRSEGWETPANPEIDNSLKAIVDKATAGFSEYVSYAPLALLAERQSEGQDYRVFCRRIEERLGAKATYSIIEIHENLIGEAVLADIMDTDIECYETGEPEEWNEAETPRLTRHEGYISNEATGSIDGVNFKPLGILATRETNETDYCFIAEVTTVSNNEVPAYALVYINENDEGLIKLSKVVDLLNA